MTPAEQISDALELLPEDTLNEALEPPAKRLRGWWKTAAIAACLIAAFLFTLNPVPSAGNSFALQTYALESEADGSVHLKETDLVEMKDVMGGALLDGVLYLNVGLRCEGTNLKEVEFHTDKGFFARQDTSILRVSPETPALYTGPDNQLAVAGWDFTEEGSTLTLENGSMGENELIFWCIKEEEWTVPIDEIPITAKATFENGQTQELSLSIPLDVVIGLTFFIDLDDLPEIEPSDRAPSEDVFISPDEVTVPEDAG